MARRRVEPAVDDNIQPDGSWRDPIAQMAMDIGQGKVNPNGAGYAAVELAHQTYGSDHINGLWGHHGNAPAPSGSGWHGDSSSPCVNRHAPMTPRGSAMQAPAGFDTHHQPVVNSDRPPLVAATGESALEQLRRSVAAAAALQPAEPSAGDDSRLFRDICLGAGVGIVAALAYEFLRR